MTAELPAPETMMTNADNAMLLGRVAEGLNNATSAIDEVKRLVTKLADEGRIDREAMTRRITSLELERARNKTALRVIRWAGGVLAGITGWHFKGHWNG